MTTFEERIQQIVDPQQAAYFRSGYDAGRNGQPYENAIQQEASAGYEEECFYNEGYELGKQEYQDEEETADIKVLTMTLERDNSEDWGAVA